MKNYYEILDVEFNASPNEIKKAFRYLANQFHPDKNLGNERFKDKFLSIKEAYDVIRDKDKRAEYDRKLLTYMKTKSSAKPPGSSPNKSSKNKKSTSASADFYRGLYHPFFSQEDRSNHTTLHIAPTIDFDGTILNKEVLFLKYPQRIGKLTAAFSNVKEGATSKRKLTDQKGVIFGLYMITVIALLSLVAIVPNVVIAGLFLTSSITALFYYRAKDSNKRIHYFLGVNGWAEYQYHSTRQHLLAETEINFNNIADIYIHEATKKLNKAEVAVEFVFRCFDISGNLIYAKEISSDIKEKREKYNKEIQFCKKINENWTYYLLDHMEKSYSENGYIAFNMYSHALKMHLPYIKLNRRKLSISLQHGQALDFNLTQVKNIYLEQGIMHIEHFDTDKTALKMSKFPLNNICNRLYFLQALKILTGYQLQ